MYQEVVYTITPRSSGQRRRISAEARRRRRRRIMIRRTIVLLMPIILIALIITLITAGNAKRSEATQPEDFGVENFEQIQHTGSAPGTVTLEAKSTIGTELRAVYYEEPAETVSAEPVEEAPIYLSECRLAEDLQYAAQRLCKQYDVPFALVLAIMQQESSFRPDVDNGLCLGLMQINRINFEDLRSHGIEPTTYEGNIEAGIKIISELLDRYDGERHKALMAYNCGPTGAARLWNQGYSTSSYSRAVVSNQDYWQGIIDSHID